MTRRVIRAQLAAMRETADELGARIVSTGYGGVHPFAVLAYRGRRRRLVFSGSPRSDEHNARDWGRHAVRRAVREIGDG